MRYKRRHISRTALHSSSVKRCANSPSTTSASRGRPCQGRCKDCLSQHLRTRHQHLGQLHTSQFAARQLVNRLVKRISPYPVRPASPVYLGRSALVQVGQAVQSLLQRIAHSGKRLLVGLVSSAADSKVSSLPPYTSRKVTSRTLSATRSATVP